MTRTKRSKIKDDGFRRIQEILDRVAIEIAELKERQEKTDEQIKKTDEQIRRTDKQVANLTDGWGKFVEGLVVPSVPKLFSKLGIKIIGIDQRALRRLNSRQLEIDVLCIGKRGTRDIVVASEVKSILRVKDVEDYLNTLSKFFTFFKEYRNRDLIGAVSGIRLEKGVCEFAEAQGLYVLVPSGETMMLFNRKGFKPRIWR